MVPAFYTEPRRPVRLTAVEEVRRARARAARRGALKYGTTRAARARRVAEIERIVGSTSAAPRTPRYADDLPGSWPVSAFSPKRQREIRAMIAEANGRCGVIEYR